MYYKRSTGILLIQKATIKSQRVTYESKFWMIWRATITPTTCLYCASMNGRILSTNDPVINSIPVHPNCKCFVESLMAIAVGTATSAGANGVDRYVALFGCLPGNYVTKEIAEAAGWKRKRGNLADVLPGKLIGGNVYKNRDHRLPEAPGRIWYEADFDYTGGFRNDCRLMYSNDGLIFVTYDHYATFYEIGLENLV